MTGYVDIISITKIAGWAVNDQFSENPEMVDIVVNEKIVATVSCSLYRADLRDAGLRKGYCAFQFFPGPYCGLNECVIEVRSARTGKLLQNGYFKASSIQKPSMRKSVAEDISNPWNQDKPMDYSASWLGARQYVDHVNKSITQETGKHWIDYIIENYIIPASKTRKNQVSCLIVGSNEGHIEIKLRESGFTGKIVASDIAEKALLRAAEKAKALGFVGIEHVVCDLNTDKFTGKFDFIIAEGVLHHIENLEECLSHLNDILKSNGLIFAVEFAGAFRFQLPESQVRWINACLALLPKKLRPLPFDQDGDLPATFEENALSHYIPPSLEDMKKFDPSEAISGYKLPDVFRKSFVVANEKPMPGSIMMYIGEHFPFNISNSDPFIFDWLNVLIEIESILNKWGILPPENYFFVGKKRLD